MRRNNIVLFGSYLVWLILVALPVLSQNVGPRVKSTRGEVWPKPTIQNTYDEYLKLEPENFYFNVKGYSCDNLQSALKRYNGMLFLKTVKTVKQFKNDVSGVLKELNINLINPCEDYPSLEMDEKYEIKINNSRGLLLAPSIWGVLRGLETFSQLVALDTDGSTFVIRCTSITDYPKFRHRGYLLDTSRHYFPIETILRTLDAMSYSKLNVFHWHIVDDNSFPYQSSAFPNLSKKGAFGHSAIYSRNDVKLIIEYAKLRGIRVIPEFDTPGHTLSWGLGGIPGLLTECSDSGSRHFGPVDPTSEDNYDFIGTLLAEVNELFKDQYMHLGGDEVEISIACWSKNKKIQEFMKNNNISDVQELQKFYFKNIFNITRKLKTVPIVWQEIFDINTDLDPNTIVQVWKGGFNVTIPKVLESGHPVLLSSCWYLNYITYGSDWKTFYGCDPGNLNKTFAEANPRAAGLLLGGEACMWAEYADETNVLSRSWPRASAVAEVLWSHATNVSEAESRLEEHVCRMRRRGVPAEPANGPGYCDY